MATEKRLIDANALWEYVKTTPISSATRVTIMCLLDIAPTVDAVEVVRCKDCKYSHDHEINRNYRCHRHALDGYSQVFDAKFTDNDFCSYGVRRTDNEID